MFDCTFISRLASLSRIYPSATSLRRTVDFSICSGFNLLEYLSTLHRHRETRSHLYVFVILLKLVFYWASKDMYICLKELESFRWTVYTLLHNLSNQEICLLFSCQSTWRTAGPLRIKIDILSNITEFKDHLYLFHYTILL